MDRRTEISRIANAALSCDATERDAFLDDACAGDPALRTEIEALLTRDDTLVRETPPDVPPLEVGERIAHYRITGTLGAGGMGEVYRAHDETLGRDVAIKVLPSAQHDDRVARARLVREARSAAALNHPNICTVHEVGEASGRAFIAMELVEGETLADRLVRGPLPPGEILRYAIQLTDALAHAHERGIVHRDLKNANVIVASDARLKVLDFGLARRETPDTEDSRSVLTQAGTVMGTLAYMAPEQLRGRRADARSDIWALGVMLYEMLAGRRPFRGQTTFELTAAILGAEPPPLDERTPPGLRAVVERCMARSPEERYASASELKAALASIDGEERSPVRARRRDARPFVHVRISRRMGLAVAGILLGLIAAAVAIRQWAPADRPDRALAVLPLSIEQDDPALQYLADGMTESLIDHLGRLDGLHVVPASAAFRFRGADALDAGRALGADTVLAGTLHREGDRVRIEVALRNVATGAESWGNRYERSAAAVLGLEEQIAGAIVDEGLRLRLTDDDRRELARTRTTDPEAYDLYLQARYVQRHATGDDYFIARQLLERAIVRDPDFAQAHAMLGGTYAMMAVDGLERPTVAWPLNNRHMRRALQIDPGLEMALGLAHAQAFFFDWDWRGAEAQRNVILRSHPGDLEPALVRSLALERWALGDSAGALELIRKARELDPSSPDYARLEADYLASAGNLDAAIELYRRSIRADPNDPNGYFGLAEALAKAGRFDEAIETRRKAHEIAGDTSLDALFASAHGEKGYRGIDRRWAEIQLETLTARAELDYVSPLDLARLHAQLGHAEKTFEHLDAAFVDRAPGLVFLNVDPAWDAIRDDPRFRAAVERVGLPLTKGRG